MQMWIQKKIFENDSEKNLVKLKLNDTVYDMGCFNFCI